MADILDKRPMDAEMTVFKTEVDPNKLNACIDDILMRLSRLEDVQPVDRWISVEDRFPDNDGWYLVYKFKQVRVAEWCESCWYNERDLPIDDVAISHWMPLPEPPNKT